MEGVVGSKVLKVFTVWDLTADLCVKEEGGLVRPGNGRGSGKHMNTWTGHQTQTQSVVHQRPVMKYVGHADSRGDTTQLRLEDRHVDSRGKTRWFKYELIHA